MGGCVGSSGAVRSGAGVMLVYGASYSEESAYEYEWAESGVDSYYVAGY